jgi:hypothetical protein
LYGAVPAHRDGWGTNGVNTAAGLKGQRLAQGLELRQQIAHGPASLHHYLPQ